MWVVPTDSFGQGFSSYHEGLLPHKATRLSQHRLPRCNPQNIFNLFVNLQPPLRPKAWLQPIKQRGRRARVKKGCLWTCDSKPLNEKSTWKVNLITFCMATTNTIRFTIRFSCKGHVSESSCDHHHCFYPISETSLLLVLFFKLISLIACSKAKVILKRKEKMELT